MAGMATARMHDGQIDTSPYLVRRLLGMVRQASRALAELLP
jgi:hypothetical protein